MILHLNHTRRESAATTTTEVVGAVLALLAGKDMEPAQFARLQIYLDWLQYKHNFREPVAVTLPPGNRDSRFPSEIRIDSRQVAPGAFLDTLRKAICSAKAAEKGSAGRLYLEEFQSFRDSIAWQFNRLYWQRLKEWERATGKPYEQALPGGKSDGHNPEAISDSVAEFWTLLKDLETRNQLPPEVFLLEIGVGMGTRARMWLDCFAQIDRDRGTNFYPRLRLLLGDYSLSTLERSRSSLKEHLELCSSIALDALDPIKTLSFLRHKILYVHSTNTYDNLPDEEVVWRGNRIYWVWARAYLTGEDAARIAALCDLPVADVTRTIHRLLDVGPE
ncbi:MAG: hypothetical protein KGL02_07525, partial [Acidobacteriota bacterium]|nr:hypothetical protein [Acidobacteriota bacterium]